MAETSHLATRPSLSTLQAAYDAGDKKPLENLVRAWRAISALPPSDDRSLFVLGGFHGEPFKNREAVDALAPVDSYRYWGGYCNHGNILFPTWHRAYLIALETALQSFVPGVMLPYWDETSDTSLTHGIPHVLTDELFELDGEMIANPLQSFALPMALVDSAPEDPDALYDKPAGYRTVRYPLSGLVGTPEARLATEKHNALYPDHTTNVALLNRNIVAWLTGGDPTPTNPNPDDKGIRALFEGCLSAPNYTVFSNTTSAAEWNTDHPGIVTSLESPHNDIHLAVGGFDVPVDKFESGQVAGSNGDMGENNTAAMDPIFYFHHCNIDRIFWLWQQRHEATDSLDVIASYKGTSSSDAQGPTPGIAPGTELDMTTHLNPFTKPDGKPVTSSDCINIETQLGYTYEHGSLAANFTHGAVTSSLDDERRTGRKLAATGIDRALFQGSFVLRAFATVTGDDGKTQDYYLGHHSVLSRRNVVQCVNCLTHLEVVGHFPVRDIPVEQLTQADFRISVQHRGEPSEPQPTELLLAPELPSDFAVTLQVVD